MDLKEIIYKRKSTRSYTGELVSDVTLHQIHKFVAEIKPLYPDIKIQSRIVEKDSVKCILPWIPPQLIAIFSEDKEGAFENAGFVYQQLDLYLQSLGLGVCWLGMGRISAQDILTVQPADNLKFVMLLAFGHPKGNALRSDTTEFKRKALSEISDQSDEQLEPARFAPSSVNSQPWYFTHEEDTIHAYCVSPGFFKAFSLGDMNKIDMGIALAHMYVANPESLLFFKADYVKPLKGYYYVGSFTL